MVKKSKTRGVASRDRRARFLSCSRACQMVFRQALRNYSSLKRGTLTPPVAVRVLPP